jgi:pimeloyl-ACP methyl ester carboxylesterase
MTATGWTGPQRRTARRVRPDRPALLDTALEGPRSWAAYLRLAALAPLRLAPHGDGHPVLVLPGFLASDRSTVPLRRFLGRLGYRVGGWDLGRNLGPRAGVLTGLARSLDQLVERHGQPVSLVGWSLGGVYARLLALEAPAAVRTLVTLGSPFADRHGRLAPLATPGPLPVPSTAVYTRSDGIVPWRTTVQSPDPRRENVEVRGSHCGLGVNAAVLLVVADRLAQPPGRWAPFVPPAAVGHWYPRPWPDGARSGAEDRDNDRDRGRDGDQEEQAWTA